LPFEYVREPVQHARLACRVGAHATELEEQVDRLAARELRPQRHVARDVGKAFVETDPVGPRVAAEQPGRARVGVQEPEEDTDRRGLAGAVGAEEPGDLSGLDGEVEAVQGVDRAEALAQVVDLDGTHAGGRRRCHEGSFVGPGVGSGVESRYASR
jgi:hypothetical protein